VPLEVDVERAVPLSARFATAVALDTELAPAVREAAIESVA
jgi:hypothetical protein